MIPTTPGSYQFKGTLSTLYVDTEFPDWSRAEVYLNDETGNLCARVFSWEGHPSAARLSFFNGEWRTPGEGSQAVY